jgi:uncharacterized protein YkwD
VPDHIPVRRRAALIAAVVASTLLTLIVPAAPAEARSDRFERALLQQINAVRAQHGLRAVRHRGRLAAVASRHSGEMMRTGRLSHVALDGRSATQRLRRFTRGPVGEVIAWSSRRRTSSRSIVHQWLNSPSHRAVLLEGRFRRVGIGARRGHRGLIVTADFARR